MHQYTTDMYEGMLAETIMLQGYNNDLINAYYARPLGPGPLPGVVLIHHMPGWDELYREFTRKFAHHGYLAVSPNIYHRFGHASPDDMSAKVRSLGGVTDDSVVGDVDSCIRLLKSMKLCNGKVGVFGTCSGGRQTFLAACRLKNVDAAVDCWGGNVVQAKEKLTKAQPVAPIDYTKDLSCPLLGLFGEEDYNPTKDQIGILEAELKKHGKNYEFHIYPKAGHGFFYYTGTGYRPEQAIDGWKKLFEFFEKHLVGRN